MRALSDPDVCLPGDAGLLRALRNLNGAGAVVDRQRADKARPAAELLSVAERWRPWRSYATHYLWATLESAPAEVADTQRDEIAV
jgi:3-methyladenine DNA glycosylase/8-oxoguanine DNA glycosylase